jgi:hypothetical protein
MFRTLIDRFLKKGNQFFCYESASGLSSDEQETAEEKFSETDVCQPQITILVVVPAE